MFVELVFFWNGANNHNRKYKGRDSDEKRNVLAFVSGFSADTLWLRHFGGRYGRTGRCGIYRSAGGRGAAGAFGDSGKE